MCLNKRGRTFLFFKSTSTNPGAKKEEGIFLSFLFVVCASIGLLAVALVDAPLRHFCKIVSRKRKREEFERMKRMEEEKETKHVAFPAASLVFAISTPTRTMIQLFYPAIAISVISFSTMSHCTGLDDLGPLSFSARVCLFSLGFAALTLPIFFWHKAKKKKESFIYIHPLPS